MTSLPDVYGKWISNYGISAFRVDTARHVDDKFFKNWSPLIQAKAKSSNINDFTIFGEVFDYSVFNLMTYVRQNKIQTVLDLLRDYFREYRPKEYLFNGFGG